MKLQSIHQYVCVDCGEFFYLLNVANPNEWPNFCPSCGEQGVQHIISYDVKREDDQWKLPFWEEAQP